MFKNKICKLQIDFSILWTIKILIRFYTASVHTTVRIQKAILGKPQGLIMTLQNFFTPPASAPGYFHTIHKSISLRTFIIWEKLSSRTNAVLKTQIQSSLHTFPCVILWIQDYCSKSEYPTSEKIYTRGIVIFPIQPLTLSSKTSHHICTPSRATNAICKCCCIRKTS